MNKKNVMLTISEEHRKDAREISKEILGRQNVSALFAFLIEKYKREN